MGGRVEGAVGWQECCVHFFSMILTMGKGGDRDGLRDAQAVYVGTLVRAGGEVDSDVIFQPQTPSATPPPHPTSSPSHTAPPSPRITYRTIPPWPSYSPPPARSEFRRCQQNGSCSSTQNPSYVCTVYLNVLFKYLSIACILTAHQHRPAAYRPRRPSRPELHTVLQSDEFAVAADDMLWRET